MASLIPDALVAHATFDPDGKRIPIPKHLSDRLEWLSGSEPVAAWLWMVSAGRYRLLSNEQVMADPELEALHNFIHQQELVPSIKPSASTTVEETCMIARLQPTQLKLNKSYWRLSFPPALDELVPSGCDRKSLSILLSPHGYLEIWYTEILRTALFRSAT
jgi:hypothetical protein